MIAIVAVGYRAPESKTPVANVGEVARTTPVTPQATSVNEVVATTIAATAAEAADLSVANNVANLSVSLAAKSEVSQANDSTISKPQIVQPSADRREIISYTTKAGDTVDMLSQEYGVSKDTIKWANNLTSDALDAGKTLAIPPVDGVIYTVKGGDTVDSIASKYKADKNRIISFNDLELTGAKEGARIVVPAGQVPEKERPGYVAPVTYVAPSSSTGTSSGGSSSGNFMAGSVGNKYAYGYCTWYAYERSAAMGRPVGSFWGNANTWAAAARSQGFTVSNTPVAGAIFQTSAGGGGYGHVGIIDSVDAATGTVTYSDMNGIAGWNRIGKGTTTISQASAQWVFIY